MTTVLVIGGADTGRAPMAAALLRRLLETRGYRWAVGSAGVLGHDGDPAEIEARDTMAHLGLDIHTHEAQSLTDELVTHAALLLALDKGTALVMRARFSDAGPRIHTLGELAGWPRDIPDPFRMQIGAWMTYAREIEALLTAALPRIITLAAHDSPDDSAAAADRATGERSGARAEAAERIAGLLRIIVEMPDVVDWIATRARIEAGLAQIAAAPYDASDLVAGYCGLLRAALAMTPALPSSAQLALLRDAAGRLAGPIGQTDLNDFSVRLAGWPGI